MSTDPPQDPPEGPTPPDEPSDLHAVEGLSDEGIERPRGEVVALREADTSADDEEDPAEHYDVDALPRGTLLGRYVLLGRVAEHGERGVIYGAYDPDADRRVTLKLFDPGGDHEQTEAVRMRLAQQAQALAKIQHPCIERIYEAGLYGPWVFLTAEFVEGIDLRQWMEVRDDPFPWPEVLRVFREAGRGLAAAHEAGIVHRDFRPSNVMMGKEGRMVVVDFGLAPEMEEDADDIDPAELRESLAGVGAEDTEPVPTRAGTPAYMAPEQHITGQADARSDQFAFCVALYEALYGERPFSGNRPRAIALEVAKHNVRPAPEGSDVPAWLRTVVARGLSPRPSDRYPSMGALLRELERDPVSRRKRWVRGAALATGVLGLGGLMAVQLQADQAACEGTGDELTEVWTTERRQALRETFESTGRPWALPSWRYAEGKLDAWSHTWREYSRLACVATRVWEDAAERTYELRQACLDRKLDEFEARLEVLGEVDGAMVDRAHLLAQDLPDPRRCIDTNSLLARGTPPEDTRDEVDTLHQRLAAIEAALVLGRVQRALHDALQLEDRIEATERPGLRAHGLLVIGRARLAAGDAAAEATLHRAATAALALGDDGLASEAWRARMDALLLEGRAAEASALGDYVSGILEHKRFDWMQPDLEIARGRAEQARGRPAEALAHYYAALVQEENRGDPDRLRMLPAWLGQSQVLADRGEVDEALAPLQSALEVTHDTLGPLHPASVVLQQRIGHLQERRARPEEALEAYEAALDTLAHVDDPPPEQVAALATAAGSIQASRDRPGAASLRLQQAYDALGGAEAIERPRVFRLGLALARTQIDEGRGAEAKAILQALVVRRDALSPSVRADAITPAEHMEAALLLATAQWGSGGLEPAQATVTRALARLDDDPTHAALRDDAQRWLEEHPLEEQPLEEQPLEEQASP